MDEKIDTRITATLSVAGHRRLMYISKLLGVKPGTEAGKGLEDWLFSEEFEKRLKQAEDDAKRFGESK